MCLYKIQASNLFYFYHFNLQFKAPKVLECVERRREKKVFVKIILHGTCSHNMYSLYRQLNINLLNRNRRLFSVMKFKILMNNLYAL